MGASGSSASDTLASNATYTMYAFVIIGLLVVILLYKNPDPTVLFGVLAVVSFVSYVYYQRWRYIPH